MNLLNNSQFITITGILLIALGTYLMYKGRKIFNSELQIKIDTQSTKIDSQSINIDLQKNKIDGLQSKNDVLYNQNIELIDGKNELITGKNDLLDKNEELKDKINDYQDEIKKKEERIKSLEEEAKKVSRGNVSTIQFDGSYLVRSGGSTSISSGTPENIAFNKIIELEKVGNNLEVIKLCDSYIEDQNSKWLAPYLIKAMKLLNLNRVDEAKTLMKYVEIEAPGDPQYIIRLSEIYDKLGDKAKSEELLKTIPKEVLSNLQMQQKIQERKNKKD